MKTLRERSFCSTLATVVLLVGTLALMYYVSQPRYEGRKLTDWLLDYHDSAYDDRPRDAAVAEKALRAIGTNAIPTLVKMLFPLDRSLPVARMLEAANIPLDLVKDDSERISYHIIALSGFHLLGPAVSNALPQLLSHLENPDRARYVIKAIEFIGPPALGPVTEFLASTNINAKRNAVHILLSITRYKLTTVSNLLAHSDPVVRGETYRSINTRQVPLEIRTNLFLNGLNDPEAYVACRAAIGIRYLSLDATNLLPRLYELSTTTNALLAAEIKQSIKHIEKRVRIEQSSPPANRP